MSRNSTLEIPKDSAYTFRDEITYELVYSSMLFSQRRHLHRQVAEWIESINSEDISPQFSNLADHWQKADDTSKAIDYLEKAGQEALKNGDYDEAERYFRKCLELDATAVVLSVEYYEKKLAQESAIN